MIVSWRKFFLLLSFWGLCTIVGLSGFLFTYLDDSVFANSTALHLGVSVAKTGAALIKFSSALLLMSMSRAVMTRVSRTKVGRYFSVGWMIPIHRGAGIVFIVGVLLHCVAHLANVVLLSQHRNVQWTHPTLITGLALLIIYITIAVTAFLERIKRYSFELFYYLHYAAPLSMILLYLHGIFCFLKNSESQCTGSTTLYWITIPIAVYLLDQAMSLWRGSRFAYISKVIVHPSNVIEVQIRRPDFVFLPGQYVYMKCPAVSWLQWHPFTLTSAPEEDHLSMHIRLVGSWTEKLWKLLQHSALEGIKVYVDGPYGCASQDHVALERSDTDHLLHTHLYVTGNVNMEEQGLITAHHELGMADPITGLRSPTHFGRPRFKVLFTDWSHSLAGQRVGVFYCGPAPLGQRIESFCHGFSTRTTTFHFHEETF